MKKKNTLIIVAIVALVLAGVMLLLIFLPKGGNSDSDAASVDEGAKLTVSTDENGVHQAVVGRNSKGEIDNNSYGTLMEYVPADIKEIHLENTKGTLDILSNTPKGEATVYTIKGYENFDLQAGVADQIASAAAKLEFTSVAGQDNGKNSADYGFDKNRAVATVTYNDGTKSIITVGDDAPQEAGTYIKYGSGDDIYVVDTETVSAFDFGLTDLMSLTVNENAENTDNSKASSITISGGSIPETIELVPNENENVSASYKMVSPAEFYANEKESSLVEGGIRGLYADSVVMVNPSQTQLVNAGLAESAVKLKAVYPDTTVELIGSSPDPNGNVNLMVSGKNVVYSLPVDKVPWVQTSYEKLISEYALYPKMTSLSNMMVSSGGKDYNFKLSSKTVVTTDNEGSETESTATTVFYGDKELQVENFSVLYEAASLIELADAETGSFSGNPELTIKYTYQSDGSTDTVEFYPASDNRYLVVLNDKAEGHARKSDITRTVNALNELIK